MRSLASVLGCALLALVLIDAFNTIVLPRRTRYGFRMTRLFYRLTYGLYAAVGRRIRSGLWRESYLSVYGPLSLLWLIGVWAVAIVWAFGLMLWAQRVEWNGHAATLVDSTYLSATTFATLGTPNPHNAILKLLIGLEGLLGLTFLGLNIGYLPVLYQSFSRRETRISLLDGRAGSPPSAIGLIECEAASPRRFEDQMAQWEEGAAELLENHLSYPMLAYFRSHHENQSWLTALVAVVDTAAIVTVCSDGDLKRQAGLTFAMGRHALADIAVVFRVGKPDHREDRLPPDRFLQLRDRLTKTGLDPDRLAEPELRRLRSLYEPSAIGLSRHLLMALPPWLGQKAQENWSAAGQETDAPRFTVSDPFN